MPYSTSGDGTPVVYLAIGCDTDPDRAPTTRVAADPDSYWRGITDGIPALRTALREGGCDGTLITWILRSDRQMRICFGSYAYPAERYRATWEQALSLGDEVGWHPHLWDWDAVREEWYPSLWDKEIVAELPTACAALRAVFEVRSTRTGWTHCTDAVMTALRDAGMRVDFSAMPGQAYVAFTPSGRPWFNDWRGAPAEPYVPSLDDYRRAAPEGTPARLVELPMTAIPISPFTAAARWGVHAVRWRRARKRAGRAIGPWTSWPSFTPAVTLTVTAPPAAVAPSIPPVIQRALREGAAAFLTYFHTDEILDPQQRSNFTRNVAALHASARAHGVRVEPVTASRLAQLSGLR